MGGRYHSSVPRLIQLYYLWVYSSWLRYCHIALRYLVWTHSQENQSCSFEGVYWPS